MNDVEISKIFPLLAQCVHTRDYEFTSTSPFSYKLNGMDGFKTTFGAKLRIVYTYRTDKLFVQIVIPKEDPISIYTDSIDCNFTQEQLFVRKDHLELIIAPPISVNTTNVLIDLKHILINSRFQLDYDGRVLGKFLCKLDNNQKILEGKLILKYMAAKDSILISIQVDTKERFFFEAPAAQSNVGDEVLKLWTSEHICEVLFL